MNRETRTQTLAVGVSIALHAAALTLLDPAFRRAMATLDATISVIEARLVPREPAIAEEPPAPAAPPTPPPVIKDTLAPEPPPKPAPAPKPRKAEPPPKPPSAERSLPRPKPEPMAPQELGATYQRLAETLLYPEEAVRRGLQGETVLLLEVGADGRIAAASVASSSGHPILDEAALRAVRLLGALGPASAGKAVLLPVRFQLE
ncbi:MAG TPA: TonB family protein [Pelomicrobium sp.]|nr:TonB family protein [Pelomicrobium sp.]